MKKNTTLLAMLMIMATWLSGCILSTTPPTTTPISIKVGYTQTFSVIGFLNGPYQWSKNGNVVPGATAASLSYTALLSDTGTFLIKVTTKDALNGSILEKQWSVIVINNLPPIANAGPDQNVNLGTPIQLNGSMSSDPESRPLTYTWWISSAPSGSTASLSNPHGAMPIFTPDIAGGYEITLIVYDGEKSATDKVIINASLANQVPIARIIADATVHLRNTATLNGTTSSDYEGSPLTFFWSITSRPSGSASFITNSTSATASITPDRTGEYVIRLMVSDGELASAPATATITVTNEAPSANAGIDQIIPFGSTTSLNANASSDPDGDPLTFAWERLSWPLDSVAVLSNPSSPVPTFTPDKKGAYVFRLTVSDGDLSAQDTVTITASNNVPVANAGADASIEFGHSANLNGSLSSDPDGDPITYLWSITAGPDTSSSQLSSVTARNPVFTPSLKGIYTISLIVTDIENLESAPDFVTITTLNHAPVANAGSDISLIFLRTAQLNGSGTDADDDPLTYQWSIVSGPPESVAALSNPNIPNPTFTPDAKGNYVIGLIVNDGEESSPMDTLTINVYNNAPTANAGPDYGFFFGTGETVQLDGSLSSDPDAGTTLSYSWTLNKPFSSAAVISDPAIANPRITPDIPGIYVLSLVVLDGDLSSAPDSMTITVTNIAPTANAGPDQSIGFPGVTAHLDGSLSSDPAGLPLSYAWQIESAPSGSTAALVGPTSVTPSFTPDREGQYEISLTVFDGYDYSYPDSVILTVGDMPVANAGPDQSIGFPGKTAQLNGSLSFDPNGSLIISYTWTVSTAPSGSTALISNPTVYNPSFTPDMEGVYVISLVVSDGAFSSAADTMTLTVTNSPPVAVAGADIGIIYGYGNTANLNGSSSYDPDGSPLSYAWAVMSRPGGSTAELSSTNIVNPGIIPDAAGDYIIRLIVSDGLLSSDPDTLTITATNDAPTAFAGADQNASHGQTVTLSGSGSDPEGYPLSYAWSFTSRPSGSTAALNNPAIAAPSFTVDKAGSYILSLVVSDGVRSSSPDTVTVTVANTAPVANAGSDIALIFGYGAPANLNGSLSYDPEGQGLSYAWTITTRPAGSTVALTNPSSVSPSFIPDRAGSYVVSLVVYDGDLYSTADTVNVTASNQAPTANAGPDQAAAWNTLVTLNGSSSFDPESYPLTYSWTITTRPTNSTAPLAGANTASPTFTPDKSGAYVIRLIVSDGVNSSAPDTVTVTVANGTPVANAGPDQNIFFGTGLSATLDGSASFDPEDEMLTYHWSITSTPIGSSAMLSNVNAVNPTLTPDMKGVYMISLTVSDGVNVSTADFISITAYNEPPTANAGNDQTATFNTLVNLSGSGTDPESQPLGFAWVITTAPANSTASLTGANTATPSFTPDKTGDYLITLSVSDGVNSATDTVTITVPNTAPTANAGIDQSIFFGTGLSATLNGSASSDPEGDTLIYNWAIVSTPPGSSSMLSNVNAINPTLTPDRKGDYMISLFVSDGVNISALDYVTITAYNDPPTANAGPDVNPLYKGQATTLSGSGTDPESQPLTYAWTITSGPNLSPGQFSSTTIANPVFTPAAKGVYVLSLTVSDSVNTSAPDTMTVTVPNRPPTADAGIDQNVNRGVAATLSGTASDPDGDTLTYLWEVTAYPTGGNTTIVNPTSLTASFTPNKKGTFTIRLTVSDGTASTSDTMTITTPNSPPTAEAGNNQSVYKNTLVSLSGSGSSDPDGDGLTYSWSVTARPSGSTAALVNPTSMTPTFRPDKGGAFTIQLIVNDGETSSAADTMTITSTNRAPTVDAGTTAYSIYVLGGTVSLSGSGNDADNDTLYYTWSVISGPNTSSSQFSSPGTAATNFTPTLDGAYTLQLSVSDLENSTTDTVGPVTATNFYQSWETSIAPWTKTSNGSWAVQDRSSDRGHQGSWSFFAKSASMSTGSKNITLTRTVNAYVSTITWWMYCPSAGIAGNLDVTLWVNGVEVSEPRVGGKNNWYSFSYGANKFVSEIKFTFDGFSSVIAYTDAMYLDDISINP